MDGRCEWCGKPVGPTSRALCETCVLGLDKYPDQNPPIVAAYVTCGLHQLETLLAQWAAFDRWERGR